MARLEGSARPASEAVAAATVETLIQLLTVANHIAALLGYGVGSAGTSNTQAPGVVDILRQTTAGTGVALTLRKLQTQTETLLTTALDSFTAEPTAGDLLRTHTLHPQAAFDIRDAFSREITIGGAGRLALRANFADAQTLDAYMDFEE